MHSIIVYLNSCCYLCWFLQNCTLIYLLRMNRYDMWSVGVVMLELIMGSPHVFELSDRTRALLDQQLEGWGESTRELAYK